MKKIEKIIIGLVMLFTLVSLSSCAAPEWLPKWLNWLPWIEETKHADFEVETKIEFSKSGDKKDLFEDDKFPIGTSIFVFVNFNITKYYDKEETIDFEVQIPYAEYYSTKDFYKGTVKPDEEEKEREDASGNRYKVKYLTGMSFIIADNEPHKYEYVFEIKAAQCCDNAEFQVRFKQQNTNLKVSVNSTDDNKHIAVYSFE